VVSTRWACHYPTGQEERRIASAAERRKLENRITQIRAELGSIRARSDQHARGDLRDLIEEEASTQDTIRSLTRELDAAKAELQRADDELQAATEREKQAHSTTTANGSRLDSLTRELDRLGLDSDGANLGTLCEAASQKLLALTILPLGLTICSALKITRPVAAVPRWVGIGV
jgi:hypothetical protein